MTIIACVPAYNESEHIRWVVTETRRYVDSVVVIDDGSTDATATIAKESGAEVLRHKRNMGLGTTINTIFRYGRSHMKEGDLLITIDGYGQHFPDDIPKMLAKMNEGFDVITGTRLYFKNQPGPTPWRRVLNGIATYTVRILSGYYSSDSQSGFHVFNYRVVKLLQLSTKEYSWNSELYFRLRKMRATVGEVWVRTVWTPPSGGKTHATLGYGIRALGRLLLIRLGAEGSPSFAPAETLD
jgi:glycosyltransferase involved in cell wall biosynthesis